MKESILVTGGVGMIGRRLSKLLKKNSYDVLILDNLLSGLKLPKNINFVKADILKEKVLEKIFKEFKPNIIFHLAAIHHIPTCEFKRAHSLDVNVVGTENILKLAEKFKTEKIIIASSGAVYEWSNKKLEENSTNSYPQDNYSLSKISNEHQLKFWTMRTGNVGIVARIFNTIGYDDPNSHLLPDILKQIDPNKKKNTINLGTLVTKRDYIDANDVASALFKMLNYKKKNFEIFNICYGKEYSVAKIVKALQDILKIKIKVNLIKSKKRKIDRLSQLGSRKKMFKKLNWKPRNNLHSTLTRYVKKI